MHLHLLGICGTFMAGLAVVARELGHRVSGSDANAYPPMSDLLRDAGIEVMRGYDPAHLEPAPDCVVIGNALTRGVPAVEHVLDRRLPYDSGAGWLARHVLAGRPVIAVAGTHGKTTTTSMLAWILDRAGFEPGFMIGGVPLDFGCSARVGRRDGWFVMEADEYDTAFFDKRSKFVHYRPTVLLITNIEFDHADIFPDLDAIKRQFHHVIRTVPATGQILRVQPDEAVDDALALGCWTPVSGYGLGPDARWQARAMTGGGAHFEVVRDGEPVGTVSWSQAGDHNVLNGLAAIAAAAAAGVAPAAACEALASFTGVRRRLELRGRARGVAVYDDFAHHPTAIRATVGGLRGRIGPDERVLAVLDPASNTMRLGVHRDTLAASLSAADLAWVRRPPGWDVGGLEHAPRITLAGDEAAIIEQVVDEARPGDHVLIMSNGAFGAIHSRLLEALAATAGDDDG